MAWTNPLTWLTDQVVAASDLNTYINDNLVYLYRRQKGAVIRINGAVYTTTSTSFVDIDATNLKATLQTSSGAVLVGLTANNEGGAYGYSSEIAIDFSVDDTRIAASCANGSQYLNSSGHGNITVVSMITGLSIGTHIIKPMWRNAAAGTAVLRSDTVWTPITFYAVEVA